MILALLVSNHQYVRMVLFYILHLKNPNSVIAASVFSKEED